MVEFDTWTDDHPRTMNVKWYRDSTLLEDVTYTVDSSMYFCDTQVTAYNKIVITINNMTKNSRFLKIYNIADGIVRDFFNDELENLEIIEDVEPRNKSLKINQAKSQILPSTTTGVLFQRTLPMRAYRENVLYGKFFIDTSASNTNKTIYNLTINDYIQVLDSQVYLGGMYSNVTASSLIADILGDTPYLLDATLGARTISGYLPILTKREALRQVVFAICGIVDTSRSEEIVIKPLPTTVTSTIDKSRIISITTKQQNITTQYELQVTKLIAKSSDASELYNDTLNGTAYVTFSNPKYNLSISGGTIVSSNINYAVISGTGGNVILTGKDYEEVTDTLTKQNSFAVSTDLEKTQTFSTTLVWNNTSLLNALDFVEFEITSVFRMEDEKVGDLVVLNDKECRITQLSYDLKQTNIYAKAKLEAYYE